MWTTTLTLLSISSAIMGAVIFRCPEDSVCPEPGTVIATSFRFLEELKPKQYLTITKLSIVNASIDKVPVELKYMKELQYLDLSYNNIEVHHIPSLTPLRTLKLNRNNLVDVSFSLLPKNIEELDLSGNLLSHIPQDWSALRSLKTLHLHKNPIDCDCSQSYHNVLIYKQIVKQGINIPEPVTCYLPKYVSGKNIADISCPEDEMINDLPVEGSGEGEDIFNEGRSSRVSILGEGKTIEENEIIDDKDVLPPPDEQLIPHTSTPESVSVDESSGDFDGSGGFIPEEFDHLPACLFDCATPAPVGGRDSENDTDAGPGPTDQIKMIGQDIFGPVFEEPSPSTSPAISTTETTPSELTTISSSTSSVAEVSEETVNKESQMTLNKEYKQSLDETELISEQTRTGEMEKATALNENNYAVYLVVACGLLIAVLFLVCFIKKRKSNRLPKSHSPLEEELKPIEKAPIQAVNEANGKAKVHIPEQVPLINGQNGHPKDEPILKSYVPLEHPESHSQNDLDTGAEEPVIREKLFPGLLTPHTERVTIRASEIPESIPKTPVLVHRLRNSDGEIITQVVPP